MYQKRLENARALYMAEAMKPGVIGEEFLMWARAVDHVEMLLRDRLVS